MIERLPEVIGIAGTNGAGKDETGLRRSATQGALMVSGSDILRTIATERGLDHERTTLSSLATELGQTLGAAALVQIGFEQYNANLQTEKKGLSIVSIRRIAEAAFIQDRGGAIIWVDADPEVRYARIQKGNRGRSDDNKTFEEWIAEELAEMHPRDDSPFSLNMAGVRDRADYTIDNTFTGTDREKGTKLFHTYLNDRFGI